MSFLPPSCSTLCRVAAVTLAVVGWGVPPALAASHAMTSSNPPTLTAEHASSVVRIALVDFERLVNEGNVILIDVRPYRAYQQAHLPGAVSIPLDRLEGALAWLNATHARIVLYCGGAAGRRSSRAAALLREHGFDRVYCLDGGLDGWVASGRVVIVKPT